MRQSAEGAAMFERDKWSIELSPILNLWKKLNTGSSSLVQIKVSAPKGSGRKESQGGFIWIFSRRFSRNKGYMIFRNYVIKQKQIIKFKQK